jgi:hypothetical protein
MNQGGDPMSNVNLNALYREVDTLNDLIKRTNKALGQPVSNLTDTYSVKINQYSTPIRHTLAKAVTGKRWDQALLLGGIIGGVYVGAKGIDAVRNAAANTKAKQKLAGYYQELIAKQGLLIEEQSKLIDRLVQLRDEEQEEKLRLQKKYKEISEIVMQITQLSQKVQK